MAIVVGFLKVGGPKWGVNFLYISPPPPQVAVFYVGADDVWISVPMNVLRRGHRQPFFEKNLLTYFRGKRDVGHPIFL